MISHTDTSWYCKTHCTATHPTLRHHSDTTLATLHCDTIVTPHLQHYTAIPLWDTALRSGVPPCTTMPHHATPCHTMPHHATPCYTMLHHATPCHAMPHHATPAIPATRGIAVLDNDPHRCNCPLLPSLLPIVCVPMSFEMPLCLLEVTACR